MILCLDSDSPVRTSVCWLGSLIKPNFNKVDQEKTLAAVKGKWAFFSVGIGSCADFKIFDQIHFVSPNN